MGERRSSEQTSPPQDRASNRAKKGSAKPRPGPAPRREPEPQPARGRGPRRGLERERPRRRVRQRERRPPAAAAVSAAPSTTRPDATNPLVRPAFAAWTKTAAIRISVGTDSASRLPYSIAKTSAPAIRNRMTVVLPSSNRAAPPMLANLVYAVSIRTAAIRTTFGTVFVSIWPPTNATANASVAVARSPLPRPGREPLAGRPPAHVPRRTARPLLTPALQPSPPPRPERPRQPLPRRCRFLHA